MYSDQSLYSQICSFENLWRAYRKARRGKRQKACVADFEYHLEENLLALKAQLESETWQPGAYRSFYIHEPKRRLISAAPFRDRVVHHALCNVIEPLWERRFIFDSYANRCGKGTHRAILRCSQFARRYRYVLQCDVRQFFPSIDHEILLATLAQVLLEEKVLRMADLIIRSGAGVLSEVYTMQWFPGDDLFAQFRSRGLPIGNLTSQFWANVYLNSFDHFVKRELRCPAYLRYVDDFLLFADSPKTLAAWRNEINKRLERFRLRLHPAQVFPTVTGIPFLGFRIFPTHRRLKRRKGIAFVRRFRRLYQDWLVNEIPRSRLDASARSWAAHAAWGDTYHLREAVLGQFLLRQI